MVIDLAKTKIGTFYFKDAWPEMVYVDGKKTEEQKKEKQGIVPLWRVKAELSQGGKVTEVLKVSVPLDRNPAEGLQLNEEIAFVGLRSVSGERKDGRGRWERLECSGIVRKRREKGGE